MIFFKRKFYRTNFSHKDSFRIAEELHTKYRIEQIEDIFRSSKKYIYHGRLLREKEDEADRDVLVKILLSSEKSEIRRFENESALCSHFHHDNLIRKEFGDKVDFGGKIGVCPIIVLEYLDGIDAQMLIEYLAVTKKSLPERIVLNIAIRILSALQEIHKLVDGRGNALEIVHADVSPHNILLSKKGQIKLIDFGIAITRNQPSESSKAAIVGKESYMSPEQLAGQEVDHRSDLYSFGIVLAEILLSRRLTARELFPAIENGEIHPTMAAAIKRALVSDRENRYPDARTMIGELEDYARQTGQFPLAEDISNLVGEVQAYYTLNTTQQKSEPKDEDAPKFEVKPIPTHPISRYRFPSDGALAGLGGVLLAIIIFSYSLITSGANRETFSLGLHGLIDVSDNTLGEMVDNDEISNKSSWKPTLNVTSPGATISIKSSRQSWQAVGHFEVTDNDVPLSDTKASYRISVAKDGFQTKGFDLHLTPENFSYRQTVALEKLPTGELFVGASPWAEVSIPGYVNHREIPLNVRLPAGTHTVVAKWQDENSRWHSQSRRVKIEPNRKYRCLAYFENSMAMECR